MKKLILLSLCSLFLLCSCGRTSYLDMVEDYETTVSTEIDVATQEADIDEAKEADIYVHISGAVNNPGVYRLPAQSRVYQVIDAAGGFCVDADDRNINQAALLSDEDKIYVLHQGESDQGTAEMATASDGKVNINKATAQELTELPGIGQSKADNIVAYRQQNGNFSNAEDIMQVQGVGQGIYAQIRDHITL